MAGRSSLQGQLLQNIITNISYKKYLLFKLFSRSVESFIKFPLVTDKIIVTYSMERINPTEHALVCIVLYALIKLASRARTGEVTYVESLHGRQILNRHRFYIIPA